MTCRTCGLPPPADLPEGSLVRWFLWHVEAAHAERYRHALLQLWRDTHEG